MNKITEFRLANNPKLCSDYEYMKKLVSKDGRYLKYIEPSIVDSMLLDAITKNRYVIGQLDYNVYKDNNVKLQILKETSSDYNLTADEINAFYQIDPSFVSAKIEKKIIKKDYEVIPNLDMEVLKHVINILEDKFYLEKISNFTKNQLIEISKMDLDNKTKILLNNSDNITSEALSNLNNDELLSIINEGKTINIDTLSDKIICSFLENSKKLTTDKITKLISNDRMNPDILNKLNQIDHKICLEYCDQNSEIFNKKDMMIELINITLSFDEFNKIMEHNNFYLDQMIHDEIMEKYKIDKIDKITTYFRWNGIFAKELFLDDMLKDNSITPEYILGEINNLPLDKINGEEVTHIICRLKDERHASINNLINMLTGDLYYDTVTQMAKIDPTILYKLKMSSAKNSEKAEDPTQRYYAQKNGLYEFLIKKSNEYPDILNPQKLLSSGEELNDAYKKFCVMKDINLLNEFMTTFDQELFEELQKNINNMNLTKETCENLFKELTNLDFNDQKNINLIEYMVNRILSNNTKEENKEVINVIQRLGEKNNDICSNLNIEFLANKCISICNNDLELMLYITSERDVQEELNNITKEQANTLGKIINASIFLQNGEKKPGWQSVFSKLITSDTKLLDLIKDNNDPKILFNVSDYILNELPFSINSIEDIQNLDKKKEEYFSNYEFANLDIDMYKEKMLEQIFQTSYIVIRRSYEPYVRFVNTNRDKLDSSIVSYFDFVTSVLNEQDIDVLKNIKIDRTLSPDYRIYTIQSTLKKEISKLYNEELLKVSDRKDSLIGKVGETEFLAAGGVNGNKKFTIDLTSIGAYSESKISDDYCSSWYRPKTAFHGICTSVINESNLGTARVTGIILGFDNLEEEAILLGASTDINSDTANKKINTSDYEIKLNENSIVRKSTYFSPRDLPNYTRHNHNEVVINRTKSGEKRNPSYLVLIVNELDEKFLKAYEEYSKIVDINDLSKTNNFTFPGYNDNEMKVIREQLLHYHCTLSASKQFGNLPVMVVEQSKILKNQKGIFDNICDELSMDNLQDKEKIATLLIEMTNIINNSIVSLKSRIEIPNNFTTDIVDSIISEKPSMTKMESTIKQIADNANSIDEVDNIIFGLTAAINIEEEKAKISQDDTIVTQTNTNLVALVNYCNEIRKNKLVSMNEGLSR